MPAIKYLWLLMTAVMMFMIGGLIAKSYNQNWDFYYIIVAVSCLVLHTLNLFRERQSEKQKQWVKESEERHQEIFRQILADHEEWMEKKRLAWEKEDKELLELEKDPGIIVE